MFGTAMILAASVATSPAYEQMCQRYSAAVLMGYNLAAKRVPLYKVLAHRITGGEVDQKMFRDTMRLGYKAHERGLAESDTAEVAFEGCMKGMNEPVPSATEL